MSAWSTLCSQTGSLFVEVMALLLYISPPLNEISKHVRFPICVHSASYRFTSFLALFILHWQTEWHQRFRESCSNTIQQCHVVNVECHRHLYASFLCIVHILIHNVFYCICADCPGRRCTEKKRLSKQDVSHIVWMFYQPVAGSLNYYCCIDSSLSILL